MNDLLPSPPLPRIGLCPMGKFVFSHEDAMRVKRELQSLLGTLPVEVVDLEGVIEDGMVRRQDQVDAVVRHFRGADLDGLFIPHCNFGTEGAVGRIARDVGVPLLLWGPRDEAPQPDGTRLRDSLCGLFASSKVLHKMGVPFSYIENCRLDEPVLREGLLRFAGAARAAGALRTGARIGQIGQRIDFFWSTIVSESELLERFRMEVQPIDLMLLLREVRARAREGHRAYREEAHAFAASWEIEEVTVEQLSLLFALRDQVWSVAADQGLDAVTLQDFDSLVESLGCYGFLANGLISERLPLCMESDVHGAVSALLLSRASSSEPVFVVDLTNRHPENDNGLLLWHAGAPLSMMREGARPRLGRHWILPSPVSGMPHFPLREGEVTLLRFDGDRSDYKLAVGEARSIPGPETLNNHLWVEVSDWPHWERTLMEGPWIHHAAMGYGHHAAVLREAARFVPGLDLVSLA